MRHSLRRVVAYLFLAFPLVTGLSYAEEQIFVLLEGIPGESIDQAHVDWIDAFAFSEEHSLDCSDPLNCQLTLGHLSFLKGTDKASSELRNRLVRGMEISNATIEICRVAPGGFDCHYRIELERVFVEQMSLAGSGCTESANCVPVQTESVSLSYERIRWIWTDPGGGRIEFSWDLGGGGAS